LISGRWRRLGACLCSLVAVVLASAPMSAGALPDGRGYELVSPPAKNGGNVMADAARTRPAVSGDAIDFASLTPFADAAGSGVASEYVSVRTAQPGTRGWGTHSIIPPVDPLSLTGLLHEHDSFYQADFSPDLSRGILQTYTPQTSDPNVAGVGNIYLRQNVLTPGDGFVHAVERLSRLQWPACGSLWHIPACRGG